MSRKQQTNYLMLKLEKQFNYIKLHGSFDWRVESGPELIVIGGDKVETINTFPILKWYTDIFKSVCLTGDVRLFISGYGFADEHINEILAMGIINAGLKIYIHNTISPEDMRERLKNKPFGMDIWDGLIGYSSRPLIEIFPGSQNYTVERKNIEEALWGHMD